MNYVLPYGKSELSVDIPAQYEVDIISPNLVSVPKDPTALLLHAIDNYFDLGGARHFASQKSVAVAVNDKTRPVPHSLILPPLLARIEAAGVHPGQITFIIAVGAHDPMTPDEFGNILPDSIIKQYRVISHNCDQQDHLVYLGTTSRKTPVFVNKEFYQADIRIVVGNIEPHHFQGYSGGAKSASIGLAGRATINHNHSMLADPASKMGEVITNPCRQDVEEIGEMMSIHYALNVVMNGKKEIVQAFFGSPRDVMERGIPIAQKVYETSVTTRYDLIIASVGGAPKDINLYQSQKALAHASQVINENGVIIIVAACPEGIGSHSFEAFMDGVQSHEQVIEKMKKEGFRVGPHKALLISRDALNARVILVSELDPDLTCKFLLTPMPTIQAAFEQALTMLPKNPKIALLPKAASTIPSFHL